jgi:regulator of sigma E protease
MKNMLWIAAALAAMAYYFQPGHWAMLAALVLMIVVHELGHWVLARMFGFKAPVFSIGFGSSPRLVLGRFWDTEFQITPWLIGGYVKIDPSDDDFRGKAAWKRALVLVGGVAMNVLTVVVLLFALYTTVGERSAIPQAVQIQQVDSTVTIARDAGLQAGDEFVSVDGNKVRSAADLATGLKAHTDGTPATVVVTRNGTEVTVTVTPNADGRIGVALGQRYAEHYEKMGVVEAAGRSVDMTAKMGVDMARGLGMMVGLVPLPEGAPEGAADVHGVVAIVQMGAMAFDAGVYSFIMIVCFISMNLAFFNILPIPMLDGGHLMFLGWEKLTGKPVNPNVQGMVSTIFFFLLIALMLFGLFNDIFNPIKMP